MWPEGAGEQLNIARNFFLKFFHTSLAGAPPKKASKSCHLAGGPPAFKGCFIGPLKGGPPVYSSIFSCVIRGGRGMQAS